MKTIFFTLRHPKKEPVTLFKNKKKSTLTYRTIIVTIIHPALSYKTMLSLTTNETAYTFCFSVLHLYFKPQQHHNHDIKLWNGQDCTNLC